MSDALVITPPQEMPRAAINTGAGLWGSSVTVAGRMLRKFVRTPQLIIFSTIQAAIFLLMFRFAFGGAINTGGGMSYVDFMVPGFFTTAILWAGMGGAVGVAEDIEHGFVDRLKSLPIPRAAVLIGRSLADSALMVWSLVISAALGFLVGFRLGGSVLDALAAFGLAIVFGFAFSFLFMALGLAAGTAQGAQQAGMLVTPLVFLSSAYVPTSGMPAGIRQFSDFQPISLMVNAIRNLAMGPEGQALVGHSTSYYVVASLAWSVAIIAVFGLLAVRKFARS